MARYGDLDAVKLKVRRYLIPNTDEVGMVDAAVAERWFLKLLDEAPTADVVPKSEVENIFAEIETCMKDFEDDEDGYLLKKCESEFFMREIKEKYAGQKNG